MGAYGVKCPVCGCTGNHEDDRHWHTDDGDRAYTKAKPPYRIDNLIEATNTRIQEQQRRELFRQIADYQAVMGQWHDGTCTGCGTQGGVIGLPGSELCRYCEELRTLMTVESKLEPATMPAAPVRTVNSRRLTASVLCAIAGMLLGFTDIWIGIPVALMLTSFVLSKTA